MTTAATARNAGGRAASAPIMGRDAEPTIFELSAPGRRAFSLRTTGVPEWTLEELVPKEHRRATSVALPEVSERDLRRARHTSFLAPVQRRSRCLSARLMHDEVQPEDLRRGDGDAAVSKRPPGDTAIWVAGLAAHPCRARRGALRGDGDGSGNLAAGRRGGRRAHRAVAHARLSRPQRRRKDAGHHPGLGARDEPGLGDARRVLGR